MMMVMMMVIMVVIVKTGALLVRMIIEMVVGWPLLAMSVTFKKLVFGTAEARMDSCEQSFPMNTWMKILGAAMVAESRQLRAGPEAQLRPRQLRVETELFCIFPGQTLGRRRGRDSSGFGQDAKHAREPKPRQCKWEGHFPFGSRLR